MRISCQTSREGVVYRVETEPDDRTGASNARLGRHEAFVRCPNQDGFGSPHPDLVALAALLIFRPWIGPSLSFTDLAPSGQFLEAVRAAFRIEARGEGAGTTTPRHSPAGGRPGLAFSGGVDSVAALEVLPEDTALFFMSRITQDAEYSQWIFSKAGPSNALAALAAEGRTAYSVESDLEFVRSPPGVPLDWSNGVPAVLLADRENLDAVCWGLILESAYRIGRADFQDWAGRPGLTSWATVFRSVGLDMFHPVAGLSEIITSKLVMSSPHGALARSCARGPDGTECSECPKCFRKLLLMSALGGAPFSFANLDRFWHSRRVARALGGYPIKHQSVLAYSLLKHDFEDEVLDALQRMIACHPQDFAIFARHYGPALELIPPKYRDGIAANIERYCARMDADDERLLRDWKLPTPELSDVLGILQRDYANTLRKAHALPAGASNKP